MEENPLWDMPYTNIYLIITPDLLHQIKKGVWAHFLEFFERALSTTYSKRLANLYMNEVDKRFSLIPRFNSLKRFPNGISSLKQMTGNEYSEIMKVRYFSSRILIPANDRYLLKSHNTPFRCFFLA